MITHALLYLARLAAGLSVLFCTAQVHADMPNPDRTRCIHLNYMSYVQLDTGLYKTVPITDRHGRLLKMHSDFLVNACSEPIDVGFCVLTGGQCLSGYRHALLGAAGSDHDVVDTGASSERGDVDVDYGACGLGFYIATGRDGHLGCGNHSNLATESLLPRSAYKGLAISGK